MKLVYQAADLAEAETLKNLLNAHGIASHVFGEYTYTLPGANPLGFPTLWIEDDSWLTRAQSLLVEFARSQGEQQKRPPWICPMCKERHGGQFSDCWRCGTHHENE